ncbi:MAG: TRAM domain-containing protein [bacterium]|nr:TRAM domain-containing protein [bacterium]
MLALILIRAIFIILAGASGYFIGHSWDNEMGGLVAGLLAGGILVGLEIKLQQIPGKVVIIGLIGLAVGLIIGNLIALALSDILMKNSYIRLSLNLVFGYLGIIIALKKAEDLTGILTLSSPWKKEKDGQGEKILDTSVIIDGRIADICETGFMEGILVIPRFVLRELQRIADSSDALKRNRGRRGLDVLNKIQKKKNVKVMINETDFPEIREVDAKLVKLAKVTGGKILTNDYNLNKVAELEGAGVLNINELAETLKPVVLPGEEMTVHIIKEGKEFGQGVAYLDDGTMVVVDNGQNHIGDKVIVSVTSVLQTTAGRMIFARLGESH